MARKKHKFKKKKQASKTVKPSKQTKKFQLKKTKKVQRPGLTLEEKITLEEVHSSFMAAFFKRYENHLGPFKKHLQQVPWQKFQRPVQFIIKGAAGIAGAIVLGLLALFAIFGWGLPDVSQLKEADFFETTLLYDREGNVLYSIFAEENRTSVPLRAIAPMAVQATLAIEDKNFYRHMGFDVVGIIRAQLRNLENQDTVQGGSTITQQLAKNVFLSSEKTIERKIKELLLAMQIEWFFNKDEILEMYLNKISYGSNIYGIEAAAQTFFGKTSGELTLLESVVLASLPKAPSQLSPYGQNRDQLLGHCENPEETAEAEAQPEETVIPCSSPDDPHYIAGRKDAVLQRMVEDGYITKEDSLQAWREGLELTFRDPIHKIESPHFVFFVRELLEQRYGKELVASGGLEVVTTLDPHLQALAEQVIAERVDYNQNRLGANNAALVAVDPKTGHILAMVGSRDYWDADIDGQVNVTTSLRQPGSAFKPMVYAAAIENGGIGSGTLLSDYKTVFENDYIPQNSDGEYKGSMSVRRALAHSRNIPAIKAFYVAGEEEKLLDFTDKVGVTSLRNFKNDFNSKADERGWTFHYGPAMAIGSGEVTLLELVGGYATLANSGSRVPLNPLLEVRNRDGKVIEQFEPVSEQVIHPEAAFIVNNILSDALARPGGSWRQGLTIQDQTVAAKTGTSNKKQGETNVPNNLLTIGYTPSLAAGVWVGNTDGARLRWDAWGLTGAAPIWKAFMTEALAGGPDEPFVEPETVVWKGKEVFPSFVEPQKNWEKSFERVEDISVPPAWLILDPINIDLLRDAQLEGQSGEQQTPVETEPAVPVEPPAEPISEDVRSHTEEAPVDSAVE